MCPVHSCVNMLASALDMFSKILWIFGEGAERSKHFVKLPLGEVSHSSVHCAWMRFEKSISLQPCYVGAGW